MVGSQTESRTTAAEDDEFELGLARLGVLGLSIGLVVISLIVFGILAYRANPTWAQRGQFGDMFGAINALFSGLALGGVIYAIFLQREELHLQRRELASTRDELRRSAEAQEKQLAMMQETAEIALMSAFAQNGEKLSWGGRAGDGIEERRRCLETLRDRVIRTLDGRSARTDWQDGAARDTR